MSDFAQVRESMRQLVQMSRPIERETFEELLCQHDTFLATGGAGGHWQTFYLSNLIFGVYRNDLDLSPAGKQMVLNFYDLSALSLHEISLAYANCAGLLCQGGNWERADLEGSLFIDSILNNCSFAQADLYAADFSRSEMKACDFRAANCCHTDFEDCDLTGSDFRGAKADALTSFKGAVLYDCQFDNHLSLNI
ncbi:MAG: pentapeptide repeat-containing protein [Microscillaceae bacterium]|nr:pentapeptide repeat-containing protein [Microscillaceae bacterium]